MKIVILLLLVLMSISCSKTNNIDNDTVLQKNNIVNYGIYYFTMEDLSNPYKTTTFTIIETSEYGMTMILGNLNEYGLNHDGTQRIGNHPDPDFMMNSASYSIQKKGNGVAFSFISSSCNDINKNPFENIIPNETESFYQTNNKLIIKIDNKINTMVALSEENFNKIMAIKKNVYCNGEVEND